MKITEKAVDVINDLIKINNDRVAGFKKAAADLDEDDYALSAIFKKLAGESLRYVNELKGMVHQSGGEAADGTSLSGDIHRVWLGLKTIFTGSDLLGVLNECERGEDIALAAYRNALIQEKELSAEIVRFLQRQQRGIIKAHTLIKSLLDQVETADMNDQQI